MFFKAFSMWFLSVASRKRLFPASDSIFLNFIIDYWSNVFRRVEIRRISRPNIITTKRNVIILKQMLGLIRFHAWWFIMNKYNFIVQERKYVLRQNNTSKIFTSPRFTFVFDHPEWSLASEHDENSNACLMFDHFTIALILFGVYERSRHKIHPRVQSFNQSHSHNRSDIWVSVFNGFEIKWNGFNPSLCRQLLIVLEARYSNFLHHRRTILFLLLALRTMSWLVDDKLSLGPAFE